VAGWRSGPVRGPGRGGSAGGDAAGRRVVAAGTVGRGAGEGAAEAAGQAGQGADRKRTATRTVFELDDGRTQTEASSVPVRYRDGSGRWRDIDTRVARTSTGGFAYGNDGTGFATRFGDRSDRLVQVQLGDRWVSVGLASAARRVTPQVRGSSVTYAGCGTARTWCTTSRRSG
jgi:hypothetical protein